MTKFPNLKSSELTYFGRRIEPYFASSIIIMGLSNPLLLKRCFGLTKPVAMLQANFEFFNIQSTVDAFSKELREKLKHASKTYVSKVVRECLQSGYKLLEVSRHIETQVKLKKKLSPGGMSRLLKMYHKEAVKYCVYYTVAWFEKPEFEIAQELAKKYSRSEKEFTNIFSTITIPSTETAADCEQDNFLRLGAVTRKKGFLWEKKISQHIKKFGWLGVRYFVGDPWVKEDILGRMEHVDPEKSTTVLKERIHHRKLQERNLKSVLKNMSVQERDLVRQINDIVYLRTQRADFFHESSCYVQSLLKKIAEHLDVEFMDLLNFNTEEIIRGLRGSFIFKKHITNRRQNLVVYHNIVSMCLEGRAATNFIAKRPVLSRIVSPVSELQGNVSYKGVVKGVVKIVNDTKDLDKVNKGDILVATMTTPNFIAAMEKASAFITDEGGILCHAAIVSREMKKPCIIGTKIATKVFKDGDMVEVDANKGVVKKI